MRLVLIFLFTTSFCFSQEKQNQAYYATLSGKSGFLAAHRGTVGHLPDEAVYGFELGIESRVQSNFAWASAYKQPVIGAKLFHSNFGNKAILGTGTGLYGFIGFPWFQSERFPIMCSLGSGIGYASKIYDIDKNPKNVILSSHFNALIVLGIQGRIYLKNEWALSYGIDLTHFSNGGWKLPNLGANMPNLTFGIGKAILYKSFITQAQRTRESGDYSKKWRFTLLGILSGKENWPTGNKRYPVYAMSALFFKQFRPKVGMEFAVDFISKQSLFSYRPYIPKTQMSIFQIGSYLGFSLPFDQFRLITGMGIYLKDRYDADNEIYHRVGMRYSFKSGMMLNLVLKTHWAKADYVEWGIGYTFKTKKP